VFYQSEVYLNISGGDPGFFYACHIKVHKQIARLVAVYYLLSLYLSVLMLAINIVDSIALLLSKVLTLDKFSIVVKSQVSVCNPLKGWYCITVRLSVLATVRI